MLRLTDYLKLDHIWPGFEARDKAQALEKLCRKAADLEKLPCEEVLKVVLEREVRGSTGLGQGVALPHGKSPLVDTSVLMVAISRQGIDFDSLDGLPVRIFILLLSSSSGDGSEHLGILAKLGAILKSVTAVDELLAAADAREIYEVLARRD